MQISKRPRQSSQLATSQLRDYPKIYLDQWQDNKLLSQLYLLTKYIKLGAQETGSRYSRMALGRNTLMDLVGLGQHHGGIAPVDPD